MILYLAKDNLLNGTKVLLERPTMIMNMRSASIVWDNTELRTTIYLLENFLPFLVQPPGTCMKVEVEEFEDHCRIKILDRNVKCGVSLTKG